MSEKKTKTVYLMVECEVEERGAFGTPEDSAARFIDHAVFSKSMGMKGKGYRIEMFGRMVVQKPVVLPDDIKEILARHSGKHLSLRERLRNAVIEEGKKPSKEQWQALIDRGAINEKGEVLLRGPGCNEDETD